MDFLASKCGQMLHCHHQFITSNWTILNYSTADVPSDLDL